MFLLADMLARIQNGLILRRHFVFVQRSNFCIEVLKLLYKKGFINGFAVSDVDIHKLIVFLKYVDNKPVFSKFKLFSSPSKPFFMSFNKILRFVSRKSVFFVNTSNYGIVDSHFFFNNNNLPSKKVGGFLLFEILF